MRMVRFSGGWVNPDAVIGVWVTKHEYRGEPVFWRVSLRCLEGQVWEWRHDTEEEACAAADDIASIVCPTPKEPLVDPVVYR